MMELEWLKDCAIPLEEERPSELMDITADYQLVSNSDRTKSLKVFRHSEYSSKKYIEKTFSVKDTEKNTVSDHFEILFYSELRPHFDSIDGVACPNAHAIRWSAEDLLTLRLDFVSDTFVTESFADKENAFIASGQMANYFYKNSDKIPSWVVKSRGIGSIAPKKSIDRTVLLLKKIGIETKHDLLTMFYDKYEEINELYCKSPMSLAHGDANHQNVRTVEKNGHTLFLDWPRIKNACVAEDAARLIQPWILFFNTAATVEQVVQVEDLLYGKFKSQLCDIPTGKYRSVRQAYNIRTISNAISLGSHVLNWLSSSQKNEQYNQRVNTVSSWYNIILSRIEEIIMSVQTVATGDRIEDLKNRYHGKGASEYNKNRSNNPRWIAEQGAVAKFVATHEGKSVFDMPVGTGRFLDLYKKHHMSVIGMDRSGDMLKETQSEATSMGLDDLTLILGDATNFNAKKVKSDIVICTRFLNWLPADLARKAFLLLAAACSDEMMITLTSIDEREFEGEEKKRILNSLEKMHTPKADSKLPPNGAHSYVKFLNWIELAGMELMTSQVLVEGRNGLKVQMHKLRKL